MASDSPRATVKSRRRVPASSAEATVAPPGIAELRGSVVDRNFFDIRDELKKHPDVMLWYVFGARYSGKTYSIARFLLDDLAAYGRPFVHVRRDRDELAKNASKLFSGDLIRSDELPITYSGSRYFRAGKTVGIAASVSKPSKERGGYGGAHNLLFDECVAADGGYWANEAGNIADLLLTFCRSGTSLGRAFFTGNLTNASAFVPAMELAGLSSEDVRKAQKEPNVAHIKKGGLAALIMLEGRGSRKRDPLEKLLSSHADHLTIGAAKVAKKKRIDRGTYYRPFMAFNLDGVDYICGYMKGSSVVVRLKYKGDVVPYASKLHPFKDNLTAQIRADSVYYDTDGTEMVMRKWCGL